MTTEVFIRRSRISAPAADVFRWHARPGAFERLSPPWARVELLECSGIANGARTVLRVRIGPIRTRWIAEHCDYIDGRQFRDVQVSGPFARWEHTHRVEPDGPAACVLEDRVEYALPFGKVGAGLGRRFVRRELERIFGYRHAVTRNDMRAHRAAGDRPKHVLITGSSGLLGSALDALLTAGGHAVTRLVRRPPRVGRAEVQWDPTAESIDAAGLEGVDAVVHLAGENIAGRWTSRRKAQIRDSRVKGTRLLSECLAKLARPPSVVLSASAVGYYGDRGDEVLHEQSSAGRGFLSEVCWAWEAATEPLARAGIRTVLLRIGVVLSPRGGALAKVLVPFTLGVGGVIASGNQYMSWLSLDDALAGIHHAMVAETIRGPINLVAPRPVRNREYTKTLGRVLGRPTVCQIPAFVTRRVFGDMADELLLASTRAKPGQLLASGYTFQHPELEGALRHVLGK